MALALQVVSSHHLGALDIEQALSATEVLVKHLLPHAASEAETLKRPNCPRLFLLDGCSIAVGGLTPRLNLPEEADPLKGVSYAETHADLRVLVVHGIVEGTLPPAVTGFLIRRETIARLSGAVDLLVVGDVHRPETFRCGDVTVVIPGATERLTFGDAYDPGYAWLQADPGRVVAHHEPLTPQPRVVLTVPADALNPDDPTELDNNNYKARPITVLLTPPADLVVTAVAPDLTGKGGEPFTGSKCRVPPWTYLSHFRHARRWSSTSSSSVPGRPGSLQRSG